MTKKSFELCEAALPRICDFFGLGAFIGIKKMIECTNAVFIIRTHKGNFCVKINLESHTERSKLRETAYVAHVARHGIPASSFLPSKAGKAVFTFDGIMAMVQPEILGNAPDITMAYASQVGSVLGKLSLVPFDALPCRNGWLSPAYAEKHLAVLKKMRSADAGKIVAGYESCKRFEKEVLPRLPQSIIHADPHSENMLFRDGTLAAMVDWEDSTIASSLMDYMSGVIYWCFSPNGRLRPKTYDAFRNAYAKERPLTVLETRHLNDCLTYVGVLQTMWRFLNWAKEDRKESLWALNLEPLPVS